MAVIRDLNEAVSYIENISRKEKAIMVRDLSFFLPGYQFMPSYRAKLSDGKKKFFKLVASPTGEDAYFPKGLAGLLLKSFQREEIEATYEKMIYNDVLPTQEEFQSFVDSLGLPFKPYDYQMKAAFGSIKKYRQTNLMATGSGKSLTQYIVVRWFLAQGLKTVIIVPNIMLTTQMYSDFQDYGWEDIGDYVRQIGGENKVKKFDKPVTLSTWQSLYTSPDLFEDVDALIIDECHLSASSSFENIIFKASSGARYRLGFTGTLPKDIVSKITILASLGAEKRYITTRELIDRGLATNAIIKLLFFRYSLEESKEVKKMNYNQEIDYLYNHPKRIDMLSKLIRKISQKGNTIVLFDKIEYGETLCLSTLGKEGVDIKELRKADNPHGIYFITGASKEKERENIRVLLETNNNCVLFGTSSILSTGINIKNLHNLVIVSGGKSSIKINQSIGRLLRLYKSKETVYVWDIVDDLTIETKKGLTKNYFYKHFLERLVEYNEHEYEIDEKIITV